MPAYRLGVDEVLKTFRSKKSGLTKTEAKARLETDGYNFLGGLKTERLFFKYLRQFQDTMIVLLLVSAGVSWFLGRSSDVDCAVGASDV